MFLKARYLGMKTVSGFTVMNSNAFFFFCTSSGQVPVLITVLSDEEGSLQLRMSLDDRLSSVADELPQFNISFSQVQRFGIFVCVCVFVCVSVTSFGIEVKKHTCTHAYHHIHTYMHRWLSR